MDDTIQDTIEQETTPSSTDSNLNFDEESFFAILVMVCVGGGVVINGACLVSLRRHQSVFHKFMKMLAVFDIFVVLFCVWLYSLPVVSNYFKSVSLVKIHCNNKKCDLMLVLNNNLLCMFLWKCMKHLLSKHYTKIVL